METIEGVPPGYELVKTDERVEAHAVFAKLSFWFPRWRAIGFCQRWSPRKLPSYRLEPVKVGVLRWHVVAFQNKLVPK